jgi:hypothetical protein
MGLLDGERVTGFFFLDLGESLVHLRIKLARGVIGHIEKSNFGRLHVRAQKGSRQGQGAKRLSTVQYRFIPFGALPEMGAEMGFGLAALFAHIRQQKLQRGTLNAIALHQGLHDRIIKDLTERWFLQALQSHGNLHFA